MPYPTNASLPKVVRKRLPEHAQDIYRAAFNSALEQYHDEGKASATAWSAVEEKYKKDGDKWVAKEVSASASPNLLHGPGSLLGIQGLGSDPPKKMDKKPSTLDNMIDGMMYRQKEEDGKGGHLVTADGEKHLPTRRNGKPDRRLMGAAWAALHEGYRGHVYEGPNKQEAIRKLKKMYEAVGADTPTKTKEADLGYAFSEINDIQGILEALEDLVRVFGGELEEPAHLSVLLDVARKLLPFLSEEMDEIEQAVKGDGNGYKTKEMRGQISTLKDKDGNYRWVAVTSSTYEDRDNEIAAKEAQEADVARLNESGEFGPLDWWHVGTPTENDPEPAYPMLRIGDCDFAAMHGNMRIESGTFKTKEIGEAMFNSDIPLSTSIAFKYPPGQPDASGVFTQMTTIERSVLPAEHASNPLANFITHKEKKMDEEKIRTLEERLGGGETGKARVKALLEDAEQRDRQALDAGIRHKEAARKKKEDAEPDDEAEEEAEKKEAAKKKKEAEAAKKEDEAAKRKEDESEAKKKEDEAEDEAAMKKKKKEDAKRKEDEDEDEDTVRVKRKDWEALNERVDTLQIAVKAINLPSSTALKEAREQSEQLARVKERVGVLTEAVKVLLEGAPNSVTRASQAAETLVDNDVTTKLKEQNNELPDFNPAHSKIVDWMMGGGFKPTV